MFAIIGIVVVLGAVVGGYLLEHGHLAVLLQPAELLIIGGAAAGTLLIANPVHILKGIAAGAGRVFGKPAHPKERYLSTLKLLFDLLMKARRAGVIAVEADIEKPEESPLFQEHPEFLKDLQACHFLCDTLRMMVTGGVEVFLMDQMMELDMEVHHHEATEPIHALTTAADALPGLGIVAAVLGVVITMGALGGPPEAIGHKVAAALVGTFLGILLCYGFLGPLSANMGKLAAEENGYLGVIRVVLVAFLRDAPPALAVEVGRRAIPAHVRPSFFEVEAVLKGRPVPAEGEPAAAVAEPA